MQGEKGPERCLWRGYYELLTASPLLWVFSPKITAQPQRQGSHAGDTQTHRNCNTQESDFGLRNQVKILELNLGTPDLETETTRPPGTHPPGPQKQGINRPQSHIPQWGIWDGTIPPPERFREVLPWRVIPGAASSTQRNKTSSNAEKNPDFVLENISKSFCRRVTSHGLFPAPPHTASPTALGNARSARWVSSLAAGGTSSGARPRMWHPSDGVRRVSLSVLQQRWEEPPLFLRQPPPHPRCSARRVSHSHSLSLPQCRSCGRSLRSPPLLPPMLLPPAVAERSLNCFLLSSLWI
ncbi:hypothetical protein SKAU_G00085000 [Synaphobranchus kaupii]|uniref:Uncharacterized protein n=1 Tax=Synaphobranchus kaupii TaxID=118154 RepID=A0A9Q1FVQ8_SYNKA|nr:hypothetical protein SKAU_G00085000 [Synaphobranchus kaupii]